MPENVEASPKDMSIDDLQFRLSAAEVCLKEAIELGQEQMDRAVLAEESLVVEKNIRKHYQDKLLRADDYYTSEMKARRQQVDDLQSRLSAAEETIEVLNSARDEASRHALRAEEVVEAAKNHDHWRTASSEANLFYAVRRYEEAN